MCFHCSHLFMFLFMAAPSGHFVSPPTTSRCGVWQMEILNSTSEFGSTKLWTFAKLGLISAHLFKAPGSCPKLCFLRAVETSQASYHGFENFHMGICCAFDAWIHVLRCFRVPYLHGWGCGSQLHSLKTIKSSRYGSSCGSVPKPFAFFERTV